MRVTIDRLKQLLENAKEAGAPRRKIRYLEEKLQDAKNGIFFSVAKEDLEKEDETSINISTDGCISEVRPKAKGIYYRPFRAIIKS
ncbi:MAG: hypothetical protein HCA25_24745 [Dolichospermum sp. DET50]|nr:hypothetical protein [Dolichospermum sp. DET66]MBS3035357.1 hypothetical protein [Dolichospermum sp. DET67]MBS3040559.1 hypothetical protein [Dolichospermum sp. DET50]QSX67694.1 MAG: hypothetical protein EZY12_24015 [Dolichospermum sp. DET69]